MSRALGFFWDMPYEANLRFQFIRRDTIMLSTDIREDSIKTRPLIAYLFRVGVPPQCPLLPLTLTPSLCGLLKLRALTMAVRDLFSFSFKV